MLPKPSVVNITCNEVAIFPWFWLISILWTTRACSHRVVLLIWPTNCTHSWRSRPKFGKFPANYSWIDHHVARYTSLRVPTPSLNTKLLAKSEPTQQFFLPSLFKDRLTAASTSYLSIMIDNYRLLKRAFNVYKEHHITQFHRCVSEVIKLSSKCKLFNAHTENQPCRTFYLL
jgi:hypothetical protein